MATLILSFPLIILLCLFENAQTVPIYKPIFSTNLLANRTVKGHLVLRNVYKEVIAKETLRVSMCYSIYQRDASPYKLKKCSLEYYDRGGYRKDAQPIASEQFVNENGDFTQSRHVISKVLRNDSEDLNCQDFTVNILKPDKASRINYINFKCSFQNSTISHGCNPCEKESRKFIINRNLAAPYSSGVVGSGTLAITRREIPYIFTLYAVLKGNKPDFHQAMSPEHAPDFYNKFLEKLKSNYQADLVQDGKFGAHMQVHIENDGPVTINIDSRIKKE